MEYKEKVALKGRRAACRRVYEKKDEHFITRTVVTGFDAGWIIVHYTISKFGVALCSNFANDRDPSFDPDTFRGPGETLIKEEET